MAPAMQRCLMEPACHYWRTKQPPSQFQLHSSGKAPGLARQTGKQEEEEEKSKGSPLPASPSIWVLLVMVGVAQALLAGALAQPQLMPLFHHEQGHARSPAENKSASWALRVPFSQLHPRHQQHNHAVSPNMSFTPNMQ